MKKSLQNSDNKLKILTENENWLAIDKPAGLLVYWPPHFKKDELTLIDFVSDRLNFKKKDERTGIVHRLDRDTSGLIIIAKNEESEKRFKKIFKQRAIKKKYLTLLWGKLEHSSGVISIPLGRSPRERLKIVPDAKGKPSETIYTELKYFPKSNLTLCEVLLKTGRTHQIRVHFSSIGHPVVGDRRYSNLDTTLKRQFLHASSLRFMDPFTNKKISLKSNLPTDLEYFLKNLS